MRERPVADDGEAVRVGEEEEVEEPVDQRALQDSIQIPHSISGPSPYPPGLSLRPQEI